MTIYIHTHIYIYRERENEHDSGSLARNSIFQHGHKNLNGKKEKN